MIKYLRDRKKIYEARAKWDFKYKLRLEWWRILLSDNPNAKIIREWMKSDFHFREEWEVCLFRLSEHFADFNRITKWETASAEIRQRHTKRVSRLANELADALEEEHRPYYPPVVDLVDKPSLPFAIASALNANDTDGLPALLRKLANYADSAKFEKKRDTRPNIPGNNARAFTRHLDIFFRDVFEFDNGKMPNNIIAECVSLRFPDIDTPGEDSIRKWRGSK
ncbi:MAG: hypothetical protein AB2651_22125 [Candidatus Thiodiazotropha sp.]